jgi:hypothetical protein
VEKECRHGHSFNTCTRCAEECALEDFRKRNKQLEQALDDLRAHIENETQSIKRDLRERGSDFKRGYLRGELFQLAMVEDLITQLA